MSCQIVAVYFCKLCDEEIKLSLDEHRNNLSSVDKLFHKCDCNCDTSKSNIPH